MIFSLLNGKGALQCDYMARALYSVIILNVALPVVEIGGSKVVKICRSQTLALPPTCGNALSMRWLAIVRPEVKVAHSADISDHSQK